MAELKVRKSISIKAETIGDVAKWLRAVEESAMNTQLVEPVHLEVHIEDLDRPEEQLRGGPPTR